MPIRAIGIDPGKATGLALYAEKEWSCTERDFLGTCTWLAGQVPLADVVVIERFTIGTNTGKMADVNWSLELIGVTRWLCMHYGKELVFQSPAEAKGFASNKRLKAVDLYVPSAGGHQNDAVRHLLTYLVGNNLYWDKRLVL